MNRSPELKWGKATFILNLAALIFHVILTWRSSIVYSNCCNLLRQIVFRDDAVSAGFEH